MGKKTGKEPDSTETGDIMLSRAWHLTALAAICGLLALGFIIVKVFVK